MTKIWDVKIRQSIKNEFSADPMMQELHEIRARLSKKYTPVKKSLKIRNKVKQPFFKTVKAK